MTPNNQDQTIAVIHPQFALVHLRTGKIDSLPVIAMRNHVSGSLEQ